MSHDMLWFCLEFCLLIITNVAFVVIIDVLYPPSSLLEDEPARQIEKDRRARMHVDFGGPFG